jgi:hydrogenase maturation protease
VRRALLLALGNDILGDDGVAWEIARRLPEALGGAQVDVEITAEAGIALMELMTGYDVCVLLDAFETVEHPPGALLELGREDFREAFAPSPHYCGLAEMFAAAERLGVPMPARVRVLGVCVPDARSIREGLSPAVAARVPELTAHVARLLASEAARGPGEHS